jgi:hypothetical protein
LNAYGESLAVNSAYREFHRSPLHREWTWQTKSKNALLIDGAGQRSQDKTAVGRITRFETAPRYAWTTGDATVAYQTLQPAGRVKRVTRDLVFVDQRYVVLRDRVELATPGRLSWLLHAEEPIAWDAETATALIRRNGATLTTRLLAPGVTWRGSVTDQFPVPIDPKYTAGLASYVTAAWTPQSHFTAESNEPANSFTVFAVLWPERGTPPAPLEATFDSAGALIIRRPDGHTDKITLSDERLVIE